MDMEGRHADVFESGCIHILVYRAQQNKGEQGEQAGGPELLKKTSRAEQTGTGDRHDGHGHGQRHLRGHVRRHVQAGAGAEGGEGGDDYCGVACIHQRRALCKGR